MVALDVEVERRAVAAARVLSRQGALRSAYVFGSYAEGRADRWSDIDVAAFIEGVETWDLRRRTQAMLQVQKEIGFDVEPHLFPASSLDHPEPGSFVAHVLRHGIRIFDRARSQTS